MGRKRPRGRVRRAGKRAKADPAHDVYVVGCVLEELTREVEALDELLPRVSCCAACDAVLPWLRSWEWVLRPLQGSRMAG